MSNYVIDENHNFVEGYSAQEVLSVLEQAIANGSLANVVAGQAIVDKLKCCVTGGTMRVAFVTQAKYNELASAGSLVENCYYYITDDTTAEDIDELLTELTNAVNGIVDGSVVVGKATESEKTKSIESSSRLQFWVDRGSSKLSESSLDNDSIYLVIFEGDSASDCIHTGIWYYNGSGVNAERFVLGNTYCVFQKGATTNFYIKQFSDNSTSSASGTLNLYKIGEVVS